MNTVTIITRETETLSFSTMYADKEAAHGLLLNDTIEVFYKGRYKPGIDAQRLVLSPRLNIPGSDRDKHGCIGSAGYIWSEVQQDCIRLFEKGIRLKSSNNSSHDAFIVFSSDSAKAEIFFPDNKSNEILKKTIPSSEKHYRSTKDNTLELQLINSQWNIKQNNTPIYIEIK